MIGFYLKKMLGFLPHKGQIFELFQGGGSNQGLSEKKYPGFAYKTIKNITHLCLAIITSQTHSIHLRTFYSWETSKRKH
jgi:hypothetical protein